MDIKWKNTVSNIKKRILNKKQIITGIVLSAMGIIFYSYNFRHMWRYDTKAAWLIGLICAVLISAGVYMLADRFLKWKYGKWTLQNEADYEKWVAVYRLQQKILLAILPLIIAASVLMFAYIKSAALWVYVPNYAFVYIFGANGILIFIVTELCTIRFMNGKLDELISSVGKISRERLAEAVEMERESIEKAAKSEQLKIDLISNVSHDLKTPLTSMVGYIELMKKEELGETARDYVDVISARAEKLKEMIESLFSLAKASSGNIKINPEPVEINMLINQILADMADRIDESGLEFVTMLAEEDTHIITDNAYMYRICQNLIENALKYSAPGTRVYIKTCREITGEDVRLKTEVTNTSSYRMDFDTDEIIERFARGDKARTGDGNGLGLAIVSTYAGALGGEFEIKTDCDQFKAILSFIQEK